MKLDVNSGVKGDDRLRFVAKCDAVLPLRLRITVFFEERGGPQKGNAKRDEEERTKGFDC